MEALPERLFYFLEQITRRFIKISQVLNDLHENIQFTIETNEKELLSWTY